MKDRKTKEKRQERKRTMEGQRSRAPDLGAVACPLFGGAGCGWGSAVGGAMAPGLAAGSCWAATVWRRGKDKRRKDKRTKGRRRKNGRRNSKRRKEKGRKDERWRKKRPRSGQQGRAQGYGAVAGPPWGGWGRLGVRLWVW
jgi:hypothetical protein